MLAPGAALIFLHDTKHRSLCLPHTVNIYWHWVCAILALKIYWHWHVAFLDCDKKRKIICMSGDFDLRTGQSVTPDIWTLDYALTELLEV